MTKKRLNILSILTGAVLLGSTPFLLSSDKVDEYRHHTTTKSEVPYMVTSPSIPEQVTFAGQDIDLTRYDRRERMDREQMAFTYMHSTTLLMIKRANRFFPVIEPILAANGIHDDFKYLMVIESNLNPIARSSAGAAGMWQFMQATGKEHGLEVNTNVDERYNILKATVAACKYLKESYDRYGDWITVAAAYNAGNGRISGELRKQLVDNAMDLWLVEETSRYMFRILAAKQVFENPKRFGFLLKEEQLYPPLYYKQVAVDSGIEDLALFAQQQGITYAQLKDANPWLRGTSLENKSKRTYSLLIPDTDGMYYNPKKTKAHSKAWVVD
ncbi:MAG: lytic transglycosylase domain-containing protein [Bacteroides sp.]|nr:lytic transglycosylase domain-containing protein [Bacteroides sp.]